VTVVVIAEDALMPAGDMAEVPRRELPTTDLAATTMSADASDVPRASMSTATGTPSVAAPAVSTPGAATASTPPPVNAKMIVTPRARRGRPNEPGGRWIAASFMEEVWSRRRGGAREFDSTARAGRLSSTWSPVIRCTS